MKPTRRIKVKNGIEYWYEETPYYDKEKKQIRHRSKYLGRNVDGQPVRMPLIRIFYSIWGTIS